MSKAPPNWSASCSMTLVDTGLESSLKFTWGDANLENTTCRGRKRLAETFRRFLGSLIGSDGEEKWSLEGFLELNWDNIQQKHCTQKNYMMFFGTQSVFLTQFFFNCFWTTAKEVVQLLNAAIKVLEMIMNFTNSNETTCFVLFSRHRQSYNKKALQFGFLLPASPSNRKEFFLRWRI